MVAAATSAAVNWHENDVNFYGWSKVHITKCARVIERGLLQQEGGGTSDIKGMVISVQLQFCAINGKSEIVSRSEMFNSNKQGGVTFMLPDI